MLIEVLRMKPSYKIHRAYIENEYRYDRLPLSFVSNIPRIEPDSFRDIDPITTSSPQTKVTLEYS